MIVDPPPPIPSTWRAGPVVLGPGPRGAFDETAVKDPSVVRFGGKWHVFYTARGRGEYTTGCVAASTWAGLATAPRHLLEAIRGRSPYGCAPQVFYFAPQKRWYLVFQTSDANYQPAYSTSARLDDPGAWSASQSFLTKDEKAKWIDFWTVCDDQAAYLFYTRDHREVMVRKTSLAEFPHGWGPAKVAFTGVHEAVHVYLAKGTDEFHMFYEMNDGSRFFGLARASTLGGAWTKVTDRYATGGMLEWRSIKPWTAMVSHGELIRSGYDQRLEYDASNPQWLIQGVSSGDYREPYPDIPWKIGLMEGRIRHPSVRG